MHTITRCRAIASVAACLVTVVSLSACGSDDDTATNATTAPTNATTAPTNEATPTTAGGDDAGDTVVVTAVNYSFQGLPETVPAGTKISLVNAGTEPHEFVAVRIPDDEKRPVKELLQLPEAEQDAIFGSAEPATVILAATGKTDIPGPVVGDGTLTEPGRYAIVCFLPVGSDDSILESEGPPPEGDSPPHAMQGMVAELTVVP